MTDLRQAAQQALKALESGLAFDAHSTVLQNLREALAQTVQPAEPCIGKDPRCPCQDGDACHYKDCGSTKARPVAQPAQEPVATMKMLHTYDTTPQQRPWVGLTDDDKKKIATAAGCTEDDDGHIVTEIFRLAEAKLKERNYV